MKLIVGLGNPGKKYENTRHNVGFMVLDTLVHELYAKFSNNKQLKAELSEINIDGEKVILAKPDNFMNNSGEVVSAIANKFKLDPSDIWVVYDDASLPFALLRTRLEGSAGGHNGVKSIIASLQAEDFIRLRIGIGETPEKIPLEDWVLSKFTKKEQKTLKLIVPKIASTIVEGLKGGLDSFTENLS